MSTDETTDISKPDLTPWQLFQIHHAVMLHYTTDYDYQKYHGKTSYKRETFDHRKDKHSYTKMKREMSGFDADYMAYYIAWLYFTHDKWVTTDQINNERLAFELDWLEYGKNRVANFRRDHKKLINQKAETVHNMLKVGDLHWATLLIMNHLNGYIETLNKDLAGRYDWDKQYDKVKKFEPFYNEREPIAELIFRKITMEIT